MKPIKKVIVKKERCKGDIILCQNKMNHLTPLMFLFVPMIVAEKENSVQTITASLLNVKNPTPEGPALN